MRDLAIKVEKISKRYRIGKLSSRSTGIQRYLKPLASPFQYLVSTMREAPPDEILWALRDVSFDVGRGEVIGIIGRNGAGKSTLLKILSHITEPTSGRALIKGRVGSLLEVGTGFHPELTGRENIYLSGAILGMKKTEINQKFDEMVDFAEIEKFIDTPVKRYSSGMYVRLAFAVAAHLEPEVLLVDEVLAVGDAAFQKKCLGKMGAVAGEGRTVMFVSHNMVAIQNLCECVVWMDKGRILESGQTEKVISKYLSLSYKAVAEQVWDDINTAPGNETFRIHKLCVKPKNGAINEPISMDQGIEIDVEYWNLVPNSQLHITLHFYNEQHIIAFTSSPVEHNKNITQYSSPKGLFRNTCYVPGNLLNAGIHRVALLAVRNSSQVIYRHDDALSFEVLDLGTRSGTWYGKEPGVVHPILEWETTYLG